LQEESNTKAAKGEAKNRRMTWPDAVALLAVASVVCWVAIASVFLGVSFDTNTVADDRDLQEILEFAPAAGSSEDDEIAPQLPQGN
jgi:hypothetical protein